MTDSEKAAQDVKLSPAAAARCEGYRKEPTPDCRWPGEEKCGPGCAK